MLPLLGPESVIRRGLVIWLMGDSFFGELGRTLSIIRHLLINCPRNLSLDCGPHISHYVAALYVSMEHPDSHHSASGFIYDLPIRQQSTDADATDTSSTEPPPAPRPLHVQPPCRSPVAWLVAGRRSSRASSFVPIVVRVPVSEASAIEQELAATDGRETSPMDTEVAPETRRSERSMSMMAVSVSSPRLVYDVYGVRSHPSRPQLHNGNSRAQDEGVQNTSSPQGRETLSYEAKVNRVHELCLQATRRYLEERRTNLRMRVAPTTMYQFSMHHQSPKASFRFSPYTNSRQSLRNLSSTASETTAGVAEASTESLLVNIGRICDGVWAQAQRDRLHVPGTEKAAVVNMRYLLDWAETISSTPRSRAHIRQVFTHGKSLCAWLGDFDGRTEIDRLGL
ncbi:hypothetical protein LZ32DRAFT_71872 [Colletotrichum eremochloae]|nr:hypothetical protein LZ32DRAFT_71872 [Colletotrichum eremochloae]